MKTYPLKTEDGELYAFEIPNYFISSSSIARFIKKVPDCTIIWVRKIFGKSDIHVQFEYEGITFEAWEPFGDNSRIHIGPEKEAQEKVILNLEGKFSQAKRFFW
ncbi:MAG: hypothetical protein ACC657_17540 [Thiohalomonadales bacterium]